MINSIKKAVVVGMVAVGMALGANAKECVVTNGWAAVSSANYEDGTGDLTEANGWYMSQSGVATVTDGVILVDDDETGGALSYTPAPPVSLWSSQVAEVHFPSVEAGRLPEDAEGAVGAVAAVDCGLVTNWYGWCSTGWTNLCGALPPKSGPCDVRMVFDRVQGRVCYFVKSPDWVELKPNGAADGWLAKGLGSASGGTLDHVSFQGKTSLSDVSLAQIGTLTVSGTMEARMEAQGIEEADLNKKAANGNLNWENLVLGLTGSNPSSIPVVRPVQSANTNKVTLALGGVDVDTSAGADVKYSVTASDTIGGSGTTSDPVSYATTTEMDLPEQGVKYYRMQVVTTPE